MYILLLNVKAIPNVIKTHLDCKNIYISHEQDTIGLISAPSLKLKIFLGKKEI